MRKLIAICLLAPLLSLSSCSSIGGNGGAITKFCADAQTDLEAFNTVYAGALAWYNANIDKFSADDQAKIAKIQADYTVAYSTLQTLFKTCTGLSTPDTGISTQIGSIVSLIMSLLSLLKMTGVLAASHTTPEAKKSVAYVGSISAVPFETKRAMLHRIADAIKVGHATNIYPICQDCHVINTLK